MTEESVHALSIQKNLEANEDNRIIEIVSPDFNSPHPTVLSPYTHVSDQQLSITATKTPFRKEDYFGSCDLYK